MSQIVYSHRNRQQQQHDPENVRFSLFLFTHDTTFSLNPKKNGPTSYHRQLPWLKESKPATASASQFLLGLPPPPRMNRSTSSSTTRPLGAASPRRP